ncbi:voltage-gated sodium channel [Nocardiopsis terrae]|uniref:Voltage-gated sodium channel n=1 Tax=Nocardiopsis terrae TaxID=372655 RepID=A0ABR9HLV1_9ACTN|nr:ion transporter [Nocardiopsis terrae]MBE1459943.1 voltage-gated sodium channel [Nocardiopsis terrae]
MAERVVVGLFVVEMALKLYAWRGDFWKGAWNWFDFAVVAISLVPATGPFAVLRVLRVLRILRVITAVPQMRQIIGALFKSVPGMGTVIGLLLIVVYASAILAQQLFGEDVPEYFGDLGTSLYTMFLLMTTENWPDVSEAVLEQHPYGWLFFVLYIVLTAFIILNLVIGVIVTSMEREFNEGRWEEDQELELVQHHAVMEHLVRLSDQVRRLEDRLRAQENGVAQGMDGIAAEVSGDGSGPCENSGTRESGTEGTGARRGE